MAGGSGEAKFVGGRRVIWEPQPGPQTWLLTCPVTDILFGGARGGGKTAGALGKCVRQASEYGENSKLIWIRHTYKQLDEILLATKRLLPPLGAVYSAGRMIWTFPNGATLKMRALATVEDAENFQGHEYTGVVVDELGNFPESDPIDRMYATLRSPAGVPTFFLATANPGGDGHAWIKKRYMVGQRPMVPHTDPVSGIRRVYIPSRLEDNPALLRNDPNYVQKLRAVGSSSLVEAWLTGNWDAQIEGKMLQMVWFRRYDVPPPRDAFEHVAQSVDCSIKANAWNSHNVISTWGRIGARIYLLAVWRERVQYGDLKAAIREQARIWQPNVVLIEDKGNGSVAIQELQDDAKFPWPVLPVQPLADKVMRMSGEAAVVQAGMVWIPQVDASAPAWSEPFETEVSLFPESAEKDQVDTMSQALWYFRTQENGGFSFDFVGPTPVVVAKPAEERFVLPSYFRIGR